MTAPTIHATDPAALTPGQWAAKLAAYLSRGRDDGDPDVLAARAALAYWRCRRTIDAERGHLDAGHVPALVDLLRHAHPVVSR